MSRVCLCGTLIFGSRATHCSTRCRKTAFRRRKGIQPLQPKYDVYGKAGAVVPFHLVELDLDYQLVDNPCRAHGAPPVWGYCTLCVEAYA